jgi:hypothetical protein
MVNEEKSPFEKLINGIFSHGGIRKVEDVHPEDFKIIMDAICTLFFSHNAAGDKKLGLEGLTDYSGVKIEFSPDTHYPSIRRDRIQNFKVVVLPENNQSEEAKIIIAKEALKEFDCLETIEKYELCLRIFNSFSEKELLILARDYDPYNRDISKLQERLAIKSSLKAEDK